jgi:hypothetical protein
MKFIKTTTAILFIAVFLTVGSVGIMAMSGHHHEPGCPFMPGEQVICQMDVFDHISAWQSTFASILPTIVPLILLVGIVSVFWKYDSPPDRLVRISLARWREQSARVSIIQELFSNGILNPKAP